MDEPRSPAGVSDNHFLAALPARERGRVARLLGPAPLRVHQVLTRPGDALATVCFPTSGVLSVLMPTPDGRYLEVGVIGREGLVGWPLALGNGTTPLLTVVQSPGEALCLSAAAFRAELDRRGALHRLLLRYTDAFFHMVLHLAVCGYFHPLEQRCCCRLLLTCDRVSSEQFPITQELLAHALGVRRTSVTAAARGLQEDGLIHYRRGRVRVLDRPGLEAASCPCYHALRGKFDRLFA
ncbi:MAG TPA: Crp/Fnr family transcriptional regulator [Gemmataceae bacterium]|nr:Crp/Fnr family transcriptional regulator [Gemmataceae bacterium]